LKLFVEDYSEGNVNNSIFLLHGFTGSGRDWESIIPGINKNYSSFTIDLPGHGRTGTLHNPLDYSISSIISSIHQVITSVSSGKAILLGYSMGARAALSFAVHFPALLDGLILESGSAGIESHQLREERLIEDRKLADFIEKTKIEKFVDHWMNMEIFNTQRRFSNEKLKLLREKKLHNSRKGLADSIRGFGAGSMPPLYDQIKKISSPVLLISGELDSKYTELNSLLLPSFSNAEHKIIKNAGHNTHLEEPAGFISAVNQFLEKINNQ
jgi:2-succinyl-6-hydroxy-2,4-cyclohexadiene-1-carboxylate synthase